MRGLHFGASILRDLIYSCGLANVIRHARTQVIANRLRRPAYRDHAVVARFSIRAARRRAAAGVRNRLVTDEFSLEPGARAARQRRLVVSATGQAALQGRAGCIHPTAAGILVAAAGSQPGSADSATGNRAGGRASADSYR